MTCNLILVLALALCDGELEVPIPPAALDEAIKVPELAAKAELSYLVQRWDRAIPMYEEIVAANPTVGWYWWRLGSCLLFGGQFEKAIAAFSKADQLGAYQWNPLRMVYHGESAWGIAAANARLDRTEEAKRWTRTALAQGLRDIRQFHGPHFEKLLDDPEYRKLVWKIDTTKLSRDEGFKLDLQFVTHEAKRLHYAPFRTTSQEQLDALVRSLDSDIPSLSDDQILVRMMGLVRRFGDGHTWLRPKGDLARLPVQFFQFPEGLYIRAAAPAHADLVGAKLLRIGDQSAEDALRAINEIASRDNPMTLFNGAPALLAVGTFLRGLGIVAGDGPIALQVEDIDGQSRRVELQTIDKPPQREVWVGRIPGSDKPGLKSMSRRPGMYWFEELADDRAIYCQINDIRNDPHEPFKKFCERLFEAVAKPDVDALIVDLRYNGGGDTFENVPLIEGIIRCDKLQQPGRLFVIIGRYTFSAAQNTTSELERRTKAILVGEPTGSRPNFIGEYVPILLLYSGWKMSISDLWWQHSMAMDYRIWTHPQIYAPPTAEAFRAQRDNAMEAIARYRTKAASEKR